MQVAPKTESYPAVRNHSVIFDKFKVQFITHRLPQKRNRFIDKITRVKIKCFQGDMSRI